MPTSHAEIATLVVAVGGAALLSLPLFRKILTGEYGHPLRVRRHLHWLRATRFTTLTHELEVAVELAVRCGEAMLATAGAKATLKDGVDGIDPQTATDCANEQLIMSTLAAKFPSHSLIGEETAAALGRIPEVGPEPTWIVDPIDGTQNFCHSIPESCVSIGLCINGIPALGVIYDPYRDELFVGLAAEGAYLNGQRLARLEERDVALDKAMIITDVGYERSAAGTMC